MITAHSGADGTKENSLEFVNMPCRQAQMRWKWMCGWEKTGF